MLRVDDSGDAQIDLLKSSMEMVRNRRIVRLRAAAFPHAAPVIAAAAKPGFVYWRQSARRLLSVDARHQMLIDVDGVSRGQQQIGNRLAVVQLRPGERRAIEECLDLLHVPGRIGFK